LTRRGYNAEREAVTLLAGADDPEHAVERTLDATPEDALVVTADHVRAAIENGSGDADAARSPTETDDRADADTVGTTPNPPSTSTGTPPGQSVDTGGSAPVETGGSATVRSAADADARETDERRHGGRDPSPVRVTGDVTGESTGTGEYRDFVSVFRDRFDRLSRQLRGRVNARPVESVEAAPAGEDAAVVGVVNDVRSTASGHRLVELEDTTGTFPCLVMKDRPFYEDSETLLTDEVVAVEGTLADDGGLLFVDDLHFPAVPRDNEPSTADREVSAALVSDVHVGSQEFMADAWERFADWLHSPAGERVEYLLIAGDMVEGVGVYPGQDEELEIVDVYEQYETFAERLKAVPGDLEIVMIPGNHDAVRLAEPQPAFDEELRSIMSAHDARVVGNPSLVTVEGVSVLLYHGVSLDELIAELPDEEASYARPERAMRNLLRKRHLAPKFGGHMRLAPEERDHLVIDEVPDVFHTGHVHKLGYGKHRGVLSINSGCWQAQTAFQERVGIDPDAGYAPVLDLDTLDLTVRDFT
ncbi:DNA polymerase II, partial [Halobacteriales archaeon SW_7_71_33]